MFTHILTICTGNICRSPLAEAMLCVQLGAAARTPPIQVRSAGIGALVGQPADETVLFVAAADAALSAALTSHKAQQVGLQQTRWADLILVMEAHHMQYIVRMDPTARGKTFLLGHWLGAKSVGDPYLKHEEVYRETHAQIEQAVASWTSRLG